MQGERPAATACESVAAAMGEEVALSERSHSASSVTGRRGWHLPAIAVGIGFLLGALTFGIAYRSFISGSAISTAATSPPYQATLIRSTACLWDGENMISPRIGNGLSSGESLNLLEGLAEFNLQWTGIGGATLSLEGPAGMLLTSEGMPTLRFGRLSGTIRTSGRPFTLETSIGRLSMADHGSIGVSVYGNEGEIHVFDGVATLDPAWQPPDHGQPLTIGAGNAIRIQTDENGEARSSWHEADPEYFAARVSMNSDGLAIPRAYTDAVKQAQPIGYWKFERDAWPQVPNVMGNGLSVHIGGAPGRTTYQGNQSVEFGVSDKGGDIVSDEQIGDAIRDNYSVEFWMKPSHYHLGSVVSLVGDTPIPDGPLPHGMLIELGGSGKVPTAIHHPGCIRFLHRSPASNVNGTSCYSKTSYALRKWQHVVATKDGSTMRLYIDGALVAEGHDSSAIPPGMRLLVGSLYPSNSTRQFNGQLDELALYNRALTEAEIVQHYQLVRPTKADLSSI
jgi:hypothetical protein